MEEDAYERQEMDIDMKCLTSSRGMDVSKSYHRIKQFRDKESKLKLQADLEIYIEIMTKLSQ